MIVQPSDFVGKWAITQKYNSRDLEQYIETYEEQFIYELLGVDLGNDLLTNLGNLSPELQKVFDPLAENIQTNCVRILVKSDGIKEMLLNLITATYYHEQLGTATSEGKVKFKPEGGSLVSDNYNSVYSIYNRGIKTHRAIQTFIKANDIDYPTFEGIDKKTSWLI
jgi:hypothetical protein